MFINEVENKVGLSKKSIRLYEEEGLINPKRESNGYRIYNDDDVKKLRTIKFLRELNVSIKDIKRLNDGTYTLIDCMKDRIKKIDIETDNYIKIKNMCNNIIMSNNNFNDIDITKYYQEIRVLNKKGFTMRNTNTYKKNKIIGSLISSSIFILLFLFLIILISYFQFSYNEKMPWILYYFFVIILLIPIVGIIYSLISRIREINGGEEDEASKY